MTCIFVHYMVCIHNGRKKYLHLLYAFQIINRLKRGEESGSTCDYDEP